MIVLLHGAPVFGAVESYVADVATGLRERSREAVLVYPDTPELAPFGALAGGTLRAAPFDPTLQDSPAPRLLAALARRLRAHAPRVVHVTDVWAVGMLAAWAARPRRVLVTHHTPELPRRDNLVGSTLLRLAWATRPEVVYTSQTDRRNDARNSTSHVVYLGIDVARFADARPALPREGRIVGNVARLAEQKGQRHLLEAAPAVRARHPDVRFALVGDGELRAQLEGQAQEAGLGDAFLFLGAREDIPALLASFDVFALPSYFEGLCYAVIEAQVAGVPVVATPVGGVPENVVPGETGILVPVADSAALAEGINALLDDPALARRLAGEARQRAHLRYDRARMVEETIALYD